MGITGFGVTRSLAEIRRPSATYTTGVYLIAHPGIWRILADVSHTIRKKKQLGHRVARIRGQVEALARALDAEAECGDVLRLIASARGAMDSLMAEVIEGHIRDHAFRGARAKSDEGQAADDLVDIIRAYLK